MTLSTHGDSSRANNFDFIRILAASLVIIAHSYDLRTLPQPIPQFIAAEIAYGVLGVWIFFCISGYLITQSLLRSSSYSTYFAKRSLRIFPALVVDILIAIFIWGPLVTTLPLKEYFTNPLTYYYFTNLSLYKITYVLPGVFTNNLFPNAVNGSLWTLPYEFTCYIGIVLIHSLSILKDRKSFLIFYILLLSLCIYLPYTSLFTMIIPHVDLFVQYMLPLAAFFCSGALFYLWRDKIPLNFFISAALLIIWLIGLYFNVGTILAYICLPYIVFWFVFEPRIKLHRISKLGDFSYGLYIYAFPVQQTIIYLFHNQISTFWMLFLSFALTIPLAIISWFAIERNALKIKDFLFKKRLDSSAVKSQSKLLQNPKFEAGSNL